MHGCVCVGACNRTEDRVDAGGGQCQDNLSMSRAGFQPQQFIVPLIPRYIPSPAPPPPRTPGPTSTTRYIPRPSATPSHAHTRTHIYHHDQLLRGAVEHLPPGHRLGQRNLKRRKRRRTGDRVHGGGRSCMYEGGSSSPAGPTHLKTASPQTCIVDFACSTPPSPRPTFSFLAA